jgi:hypothetical protein
MADQVLQVYQLLEANQQFDSNVVTYLTNASTYVTTAKNNLNSHGFTAAAAKLANLGSNEIAGLVTLGDYIANSLPTIFDHMDIFSSRMWIEGQLDTANAATFVSNNISAAFGAHFAGRTYVASLMDIANAASPTANAIILEDRANSIAYIANTANTLIASETNFYEQSTAKIDNYALANHIVISFREISTKSIIGAVGSDALLTVLNPPTSSGPYEPPIDGSNSGEADPTPIR